MTTTHEESTMPGREFIAIANHLSEQTSRAALRTAIGRYYYAAFLECRTWAEQSLGFERTKSAREHQFVRSLIREIDPEIEAMLTALRAKRNTADYDMDKSTAIIEQEAQLSRVLATAILASLDALRSR
jgi:hypothetical protein